MDKAPEVSLDEVLAKTELPLVLSTTGRHL
jgi:hypothetical protein